MEDTEEQDEGNLSAHFPSINYPGSSPFDEDDEENRDYESTTERKGNDDDAALEEPPLSFSSLDSLNQQERITPLLIAKYIFRICFDQCKAVAPVSLYLFVFLLVVLRLPDGSASPSYLTIVGGLAVLTLGLVLFLEGLQWGLMPLGHAIGSNLPLQLRASFVLVICFLLGVGVTIAEPAISALQAIGSLVEVERAAYLYAILNEYSLLLIMAVAIGVGFAASLGVLRFYRGWNMKPIILITLLPTTLLSVVLHFNADLRPLIGLAWDCGAITTGPVTVPIVLAVGIGVSSAKSAFLGEPPSKLIEENGEEAGKSNDSDMGGFGIVTLASLMPVITVQVLGLMLYALVDEQDIQDYALNHDGSDSHLKWYEETPLHEIVLSLRALVPLLVFLVIILKAVLKQPFPRISLADVVFERADRGAKSTPAADQETANEGRPTRTTTTKTRRRTRRRTKRKRGPSLTSFKYHQADGGDDDEVLDESSVAMEMDVFGADKVSEDNNNNKKKEESYGDDEDDGEAQYENEDSEEGEERKEKTDSAAELEKGKGAEGDEIEVQGSWEDGTASSDRDRTNLIYFYLLLALVGLMLFNIGLTHGLTLLGSETGYLIPLTFMALPKEHHHTHPSANHTTAADGGDSDTGLMQPLYPYALGLFIALAFSFVLGFGATFAEPALRVLGKQAEQLSQGRMKANVLIYSVCVGVGGGITLGIVKITFHIPLLYLILPAYAITVLLTLLSDEEFVNVAWDCGGVTTGPVTVPLVLALGLAFGNAVDATEGFGILTMASVGPIAAVLAVGLVVTTWRRAAGNGASPASSEEQEPTDAQEEARN